MIWGLVQRVQRGDKTAFDLLVRKYQHKVVKLVTRYLRDPADAEDVAQEAFIKAYRAIAPVSRGQCLLYLAVPHRDQHGQERHRVAGPQPGGFRSGSCRTSRNPVPCSCGLRIRKRPRACCRPRRSATTVNQAIEALPEDLRTAIVLRELEGLSYEDIAPGDGLSGGYGAIAAFFARAKPSTRSLSEVFEGGLGRAEESG